ncbi:hypothetical protein BOX15_Mlig014692g1 [Macrostomum lignano]|uniref:Melanotransferrin n=3 Tax=Macrostomum lignano TaxID=282301 RepID=A0A1I8GSI5_9PLAT|nr:hypothetical protein BOX15_Mlig014692g1 [Macrostomum lignano]
MKSIVVLLLAALIFDYSEAGIPVRWCVYTADEQAKCAELVAQVAALGYTRHTLTCVRQTDALECMNAIGKVNPTADLMRLDSGLAYYAAQLYTMRPVLAENYGLSNRGGTGGRQVDYPTAVLVRAGSAVRIDNMHRMKLCSSGVGTAEGWTVPLARLIQQLKTIPVQQCNSVVLSVANYFSQMCLPGAMNSLFNNFGSNPDKACSICRDTGDGSKFCKLSDNYAGNDGALRCMTQKLADVAFLRLDELVQYANDTGTDLAAYELLCSDGSRQPVSASGCSWANVPSAMVVASIRTNAETIQEYRIFLKWLVANFGPSGTSAWRLFDSSKYATRNLMFSDQTQLFYDSADDSSPDKKDIRSIYNWLGPAYLELHDQTNYCPLGAIRWCVLSAYELAKCERMKLAFSAKNLKPSINCVQGESTIKCMEYIQMGLADIISLDAADLYVAGKRFGLVPFVAEFYGDSTNYYAVAIVRQNDKQILVSNLLHKRTCHSGIGKATGWVVPLNLVLDTRQITVLHCRLIHAFSELVSRSCIPGIMDSDYNPTGYNPINLCENCRSGGADKCQRNDRELYYGDDGAFRCLVEEAGDIAFARHTTVFDNTAGHNPAHWARNRRSNDYEILCADGSRREVQDWQDCNLGRIPGNTLVTGAYKTEEQKQTMWQLLKYAQTFYASDRNSNNFQLFDSGFDRSDLMFQDIAQSLVYIPSVNQSYKAWLGNQFIQRLETLEWQSCYLQSGLGTNSASAFAAQPVALLLGLVALIWR